MIKVERFNNLLNEVHKKEEEKIKLEQAKQQEIQLQMKLVEDALNDMESKFKQALEGKCESPKYAVVKDILCDEVKRELLINQGYFIDENLGETKIFYNKKLFDDYRNNTKQESQTKNNAYEELNKSCLKDKKEYNNLDEAYKNIVEQLIKDGWRVY